MTTALASTTIAILCFSGLALESAGVVGLGFRPVRRILRRCGVRSPRLLIGYGFIMFAVSVAISLMMVIK